MEIHKFEVLLSDDTEHKDLNWRIERWEQLGDMVRFDN